MPKKNTLRICSTSDVKNSLEQKKYLYTNKKNIVSNNYTRSKYENQTVKLIDIVQGKYNEATITDL